MIVHSPKYTDALPPAESISRIVSQWTVIGICSWKIRKKSWWHEENDFELDKTYFFKINIQIYNFILSESIVHIQLQITVQIYNWKAL